MEKEYYLAVDIGASSGRHILGHLEDGKLLIEEIYRFPNFFEEREGHKVWDTDRLFREVLEGMRCCKRLGKLPKSMAIDTWAVDYVLLDREGKRLGECYAYRDGRTEHCPERLYRSIPEALLYEKTGIQKAAFNTIFQLIADRSDRAGLLSQAETLLMLPDYLNYRLTGVKRQEYTNASTTGLLNAKERSWDRALISGIGLPDRLFTEPGMPGEPVGRLRKELREELSFDTEILLSASHDTASAVVSVPMQSPEELYLSSGTWSLIGCELPEPSCSPESRKANLTNEGGYGGSIRYLKNIMGLWMIQSVKRELEQGFPYPGRKSGEKNADFGFPVLCSAAESENIFSKVPADDVRFLAPSSMIGEIQRCCREQGMEVPETPGQLARVIYRSLADCYAEAARELSRLTGIGFRRLNIVGGGSNAEYLNRLTAEATGLPVSAGPAEASAVGNLGVQLLSAKKIASLSEFRRLVGSSFPVKEYLPDGEKEKTG